jgi:serine protease Do
VLGASLASVIDDVQGKVVKIYGAGGVRGLEAYQSGLIVSADGHVLTAWSTVLDSDVVTVTLHDGRRMEAKLVGADPQLEIAVLKIDASQLPHFDLRQTVPVAEATRVLAFSNLFGIATGDESVSVMQGWIAARAPLNGRRGGHATPYQGMVYVVDAITSNPGAAGGTLTNRRGELIGMLGKELRHAESNTWLNYTLPMQEIAPAVERILAGVPPPPGNRRPAGPDRPLTLGKLGILLVPDVFQKTPPFVDTVRRGSRAEAAGLKVDDLVVLVDAQFVRSSSELRQQLAAREDDVPIRLTVMRGSDLMEIEIGSEGK